MADQMKTGRTGKFPSIWINPELWGFLCKYDPIAEVDENYERLAKAVKKQEA